MNNQLLYQRNVGCIWQVDKIFYRYNHQNALFFGSVDEIMVLRPNKFLLICTSYQHAFGTHTEVCPYRNWFECAYAYQSNLVLYRRYFRFCLVFGVVRYINTLPTYGIREQIRQKMLSRKLKQMMDDTILHFSPKLSLKLEHMVRRILIRRNEEKRSDIEQIRRIRAIWSY
jgi:hypothetical protein